MINFIKRKLKLEEFSSILLMIWITLPFIMIVCHAVQGARGKFPTREEIEAAGLTFQYVTLYYNRQTYQLLFHILGVISILYCLLMFFSTSKQLIFSEKMFNKKKFIYYLLGLICWSVVCAFFSDDFLTAFFGEDYLCDGLSSYFIYASVYTIAYSITSEIDKLKVIRYFAFMVTTLSILMLIQSLHVIDFLDYIFTTRSAIIFLQFNHYGYVLCMGICTSIGLLLYDNSGSKKIDILYALAFIINYVALLINDTFGAWIAVVVAVPIICVLYYFSGKPKKIDIKVLIIGYICMLALSFLLSDSLRTNISTFASDVGNIVENNEEAARAGTGRLTLWKDTIERIKTRPVFGYGPEGFYGTNAITNGDSPHNEYLQITGFLGIPGIALYLTAIILLLKHHVEDLKNLSPVILVASGAFGGYLISACFGNPVFNTFPYYMMFFGLASSYEVVFVYKKEKNKKNKYR